MIEKKSLKYFFKPYILNFVASTLFFAATATYAETKADQSANIFVNGSGATISIKLCHESSCKTIKTPAEMLDAMDDGYSQISLEDLTLDGVNEIILTHSAEGNVNICSKVFQYNNESKKLQNLTTLKKQICNYSINENNLISTYKDGAKWHEDIYKTDNNSIHLAFSDSCIGCEYIKRIVYSDDAKTENILVTDNPNYLLRTPISTTITTKKAVLYSEPTIKYATKMYLISGDEVLLTDDSSDESHFWFKIRYTTKKGKHINAWLKCEDIEYCD
ncbi:XAC2610-related protein [Pseudomonas sp. zbq_18]|uniref:XAC2610-related protein n=1 Tax=Pseudomonadota TaxID=1224 RepID=UPI00370A791E